MKRLVFTAILALAAIALMAPRPSIGSLQGQINQLFALVSGLETAVDDLENPVWALGPLSIEGVTVHVGVNASATNPVCSNSNASGPLMPGETILLDLGCTVVTASLSGNEIMLSQSGTVQSSSIGFQGLTSTLPSDAPVTAATLEFPDFPGAGAGGTQGSIHQAGGAIGGAYAGETLFLASGGRVTWSLLGGENIAFDVERPNGDVLPQAPTPVFRLLTPTRQ